MERQGLIGRIHCDTAEEFLDTVRPLSRLWTPWGKADFDGSWGNEWMWRGHADAASWKLCGSSVRDYRNFDVHAATNLELNRLLAFCSTCMQSGLRVPESAHLYFKRIYRADAVRRSFEDGMAWVRMMTDASVLFGELQPDERAVQHFPEEEIWELMALARHHGMPSRLLDWSADPFVAAYFAAKDAAHWWTAATSEVRQERADHRLIVWGLNAAWTAKRSRELSHPDSGAHLVVQYIDVPQWGNAHQLGQRGRFTVNKATDSSLLEAHMNHTIEGAVEHWGAGRECANEETVLRGVTLRHSEAPRLLRMLATAGIDNGRVFPTYAGMIEREREMALWDVQPVYQAEAPAPTEGEPEA